MAKKKRKSLLPKRIAGVKVPKSVRKGPLGELLASRTGQALIAEAIMAASAVGVAKKAKDKADAQAGSNREATTTSGLMADAFRRWQASQGHGKPGDAAGAAIAYALGEAARAFVRSLNEARSQPAKAAEEPYASGANGHDDEGDSKKKPASSPPPLA